MSDKDRPLRLVRIPEKSIQTPSHETGSLAATLPKMIMEHTERFFTSLPPPSRVTGMPLANIRSTVRNAKRYAEIAHVLLRYGFTDILTMTGLSRFLHHDSITEDKKKKKAEKRRRKHPNRMELPHDDIRDLAELPRPTRLRHALEELGPTFIKLGQILSTRGDLLEDEWINELKKLQDDCPPFPYEEVDRILQHEFPNKLDDLFSSISEEPLAAASMAQVHKATLIDGTPVVIKVLRPKIRETIEADMSILEQLAQMAERHDLTSGFSPTEVIKEFSSELKKEVDLTTEARSCDRLNATFKDNPNISFPTIYWQATTRNVVTMSEIVGLRFSQYEPGKLPTDELHTIMGHCTDAVFHMCLETGFFHADPHAGNLFALDDGKVCFIDCGMTGQIDNRTTEDLGDLVGGVLMQNVDRVIRSVSSLTDVDPDIAQQRKFRNDVSEFISHFRTNTVSQLNFAALLGEFFELLREYHIQCPSDLVFLIKALTTIEGVAEQLDSSWDLVGHVEPHIKKLVRRRYTPRAIRERVIRVLTKYVDVLEEAPSDLLGLLNHLRHNQMTVNLDLIKLDKIDNTVEHASRSTSQALIIAALVISSSILILSDRIATTTGYLIALGVIGFVMAGTMSMWLFLTTYFRKRK